MRNMGLARKRSWVVAHLFPKQRQRLFARGHGVRTARHRARPRDTLALDVSCSLSGGGGSETYYMS